MLSVKGGFGTQSILSSTCVIFHIPVFWEHKGFETVAGGRGISPLTHSTAAYRRKLLARRGELSIREASESLQALRCVYIYMRTHKHMHCTHLRA